MREKLIPSKLKKPVGLFSWGIRAGSYIFISGVVAVDAAGEVVGNGDAKAQAKQIFENIASILDASGASPKSIVKLVTFVRDIKDYPRIGEARAEFYKRHSITEEDYPVSTAVEARLINDDFLVEIEAVAYIE